MLDNATVLWIVVVLVGIVLFLIFYSRSQYKALRDLYIIQVTHDDIVYTQLKHSSLISKMLFRWTTKDVEHYFS